jgi:hypothetical protein
MKGTASMWLVISLRRASLNIIIRSWLNKAIVAATTVPILMANVKRVFVRCRDRLFHIFFNFSSLSRFHVPSRKGVNINIT